mgnify:CR=1 FL=1|jgi:glucose-1-phosphate thymidylyltransferase, short form
MKGIVLAGGNGTRLYPLTISVSKQLLPVYDKPMIYYPISVLMLAGIREILIISSPQDLPRFKQLLGTGEKLGLSFSYAVQDKPDGIAQAFTIGESFIGKDSVALILGDNIFFGQGFSTLLRKCSTLKEGATIIGYRVHDPSRFCVIEFNEDQSVKNLEEKPSHPRTDFVATGLYFYDNNVIDIAKHIEPSQRNEREITDLNKVYLRNNQIKVELLGRGFSWFDTGTPQSLFEASQFIESVEKRQGFKVACLEEVAYYMGYISESQLIKLAKTLSRNDYGKYLMKLAKKERLHYFWDYEVLRRD